MVRYQKHNSYIALMYSDTLQSVNILIYFVDELPYPRQCSPGVLFVNNGIWVGVNSKNPLKSGLFQQKVGVSSRKTPKTRLFTLPGALFKSGAALARIRYSKY